MLFTQFLANKEVNSARHETLASSCYSGGNHSVSKRLVNCTLIVVLDDCRKSIWLEPLNLENGSFVNSENFDATELSF